ncbi:winged helix DNA-binding domain-containing protein [Arthrobacter sp. SA17]
MTATQAQDLPAALWAVGLRSSGAGLGSVRSALDEGEIVRSWPMRGTLHLVAPEDLRWMLSITTPRMIRAAATRHRQLEISERDIKLCRDVALEMLTGGKAATRQEMFAGFEAAGQVTKEQRGVHLLGLLCQTASIVLGPLAGNQQKFAVFDEWIPGSRNLEREEGIAEWVLRYMRSHGPATERDFSWWSGIPLTEVRQGLSSVESELVKLVFEGTTYWLPPSTAELLDGGIPGERSVQALPAFDEFLLGYMDRSLVLPRSTRTRLCPAATGCSRKSSCPEAPWWGHGACTGVVRLPPSCP